MKRFFRTTLVVLVAIGTISALNIGVASAKEATSKESVRFSRMARPTPNYKAPRVKATIAKRFTFKKFGWALDDSDFFVATRVGSYPGGTTVKVRGPRFHCQEGERLHFWGQRANGKLVVGKGMNFGRACVTNYQQDVNDVCGPDQDKKYLVTVTVHDGTLNSAGRFRLRLSDGTYLYSKGYTNGTNYQREYYFDLKYPTAKVDLNHLGKSTGFIAPSLGSYWTAEVKRFCIGYGV